MKRIEFLVTYEKMKMFSYNYDRQNIIKMDDKELSIEEIISEDTRHVDILINDFNNNKLLCECIKNLDTGVFNIEFISGEDDNWMIKRLECVELIDIG